MIGITAIKKILSAPKNERNGLVICNVWMYGNEKRKPIIAEIIPIPKNNKINAPMK